MPLPTETPNTITAGATTAWQLSFADYLATDGWSASLKLRGPSPGLDVNATTNDDDFVFTLTAAQTATMGGGVWAYQIWATKSGEAYLAESGQLSVTAALPAKNIAVDNRSDARRILDAIDALLLKKATKDQQEYQIADRMLQTYKPTELVEMRRYYAGIVAREEAAAQQSKNDDEFFPRTIYTKFVRPW